MESEPWRLVSELLAEALKRAPSQREPFLSEQCPDPRVRSEVEALLRAYRPVASPDPFTTIGDEADDLPGGTRIGPYVIVERLGRGGMGQVFLAIDTRLRRRVALKSLLPAETGQDHRRAQVLHEARAVARVSHPGVAAVHDIVEHDTHAFIVFEYVEGESLEAKLRRERLSTGSVLAIGRQLAAALAAAHAKGLVHRDLKPGNVQVMPDGTAKILDFGIAQAVATLTTVPLSAPEPEGAAAAAGASYPVTPPQPWHLRAGTPGYMSPEQMLGRRVDSRSDVFSLGVILFEMATGRLPPIGRVLAPASPLPRADAVDATVPAAMAEVIARALEIDADSRYQSAGEVEAALSGLERKTTHAAAYATAGVAVSSPRRVLQRALMTMGGGGAALGLLGLINTAAFNSSLGRTGAFAVEPFTAYFVWGLRSVVAPLTYLALVTIVVSAVRFVIRIIRLADAIDRPLRSSQTTLSTIVSRIGLNDPGVLCQGLAAYGLVAFAAIVWHYRDIILASLTDISAAPPGLAWPLRPGNAPVQARYGLALDFVALTLGLGLWRAIRLRSRLGLRHGTGAVVAVAAVLGLTILMVEMPYRVLWQNAFERVQWRDARCYVIGEGIDTWLLHCPDIAPPRNRVVPRGDPGVARSGIVESLFVPAGDARPAGGASRGAD